MTSQRIAASTITRLARHFRASLVPVFSFGENEIYDQVSNPEGSKLRSLQNSFKNVMGFAPPLIKGRGLFQYTFGYIPFRHPIHTIGMVSSNFKYELRLAKYGFLISKKKIVKYRSDHSFAFLSGKAY